ncbi:MAG: hypothetical protein F6K36_23735 [Symploca sp. SIO3C6]|uniref:Uncharacterized protein n=1 Tax=Symploca sp. SIO1C4 TaxID=2607765 RepID=A0A6B3NHV2_9CYAN|nr:hypothetical protein [Symploca sp. SIO3C6]NER28898.1 hypothetical protein [Symploca sp. SIO1C4]
MKGTNIQEPKVYLKYGSSLDSQGDIVNSQKNTSISEQICCDVEMTNVLGEICIQDEVFYKVEASTILRRSRRDD